MPEARQDHAMHIRYGHTLDVVCEAPTELITRLDVHSSGRADITEPDDLVATALADGAVLDGGDIGVDRFGNLFRRIAVPAGGARLSAQGIIHDSGFADSPSLDARAMAADTLSEDERIFLAESRYCPQAGVAALARVLAAGAPAGRATVEAVVDHVRQRLRLDPSATCSLPAGAASRISPMSRCRSAARLAFPPGSRPAMSPRP
jgi:hypothetical protein